jgi:cobalt-precorrin-7 (C5)-methyltransferase
MTEGANLAGQELSCDITIVGCGPGAPDYLTPAAREAIASADVLVGARRVLDGLPPTRAERIVVGADIAKALEAIAAQVGRQRITVVVSGDPGVCSLAQPVIRRFGRTVCRVVPGITAMQVAFARLGLDWFDATLLSAHEGIPAVGAEALAHAPKIAVLAGNASTLPWLRTLGRTLAKTHTLYVCENLTLPDERVHEMSAEGFETYALPGRSVVVFVQEGTLT